MKKQLDSATWYLIPELILIVKKKKKDLKFVEIKFNVFLFSILIFLMHFVHVHLIHINIFSGQHENERAETIIFSCLEFITFPLCS